MPNVQNEANSWPGPTRWIWNPPLYAGRTPFRLSTTICFDFRRGHEYTMPSADESTEDECWFID